MSKFEPPLTDDELREKLRITLQQIFGHSVSNPLLNKFLMPIIQSQKQSYADTIIGNVENHNEQCTEYRKANQNHSICICNARQRNNLRLEQRERNVSE